MFFYISKILWFFAQPSNALLILLFVGTVMLWSRWARWGRRVVLLSGLLFFAAGLSPLGHALILPLENRFARADLGSGESPSGIIILGGAQDMSIVAARGVIAVNEAAERLIEAAALARRHPEAKVMFSGGSNAVFGDKLSEASGARDLLVGLGIAPQRLHLEGKSRNTFENAKFSARLANPETRDRWLLVTSASHMPRAIGSFRSVGFNVEPWPVDYRTRGKRDIRRFFPKPSEGLRRVDLATREWMGLLAYRLTGRTLTLFPGPQ